MAGHGDRSLHRPGDGPRREEQSGGSRSLPSWPASKTSLAKAARADALVEGVFDLWTSCRPFYYAKMEQDKEREATEWAKFKKDLLVNLPHGNYSLL